MRIGDRVVVVVQPALGRVGTIVELADEAVAVKLDAGSTYRGVVADVIPLR